MIEWEPAQRPVTSELSVHSIKIFDEKRRLDTLLTTMDDLYVEIEYEIKETIKDLRICD